MGYPIALTPIIIAIMSGTFVYLGVLAGAKFANLKMGAPTAFSPELLINHNRYI
ncbi:hypothetical protein GCM10020331_051080 [Ectobacillus funiculus]